MIKGSSLKNCAMRLTFRSDEDNEVPIRMDLILNTVIHFIQENKCTKL